MPERALVFVDGNNWYHGLRAAGLRSVGQLDYRKISRKLLGQRSWIGTRYYVGRVPRIGDVSLQAAQRRFLARLTQTDPRIAVCLGRIEARAISNPVAVALREYLAGLTVRLPTDVYRDLVGLAARHAKSTVMVEKAVDVMLAVDLTLMAYRDAFDTAYLLSADGDFTPAVDAVRLQGKKVIAASTEPAARLSQHATAHIRLQRDWFSDCY